jgi:hypothetical protein
MSPMIIAKEPPQKEKKPLSITVFADRLRALTVIGVMTRDEVNRRLNGICNYFAQTMRR